MYRSVKGVIKITTNHQTVMIVYIDGLCDKIERFTFNEGEPKEIKFGKR
jgi:hypothetical protein